MSSPGSTAGLRRAFSIGHDEQQLVGSDAELGAVLQSGLFDAGFTDIGLYQNV